MRRRCEAGHSGRGQDGNVGVDDSAYQPACPHHHRHLGCVSDSKTNTLSTPNPVHISAVDIDFVC